MTPQQEKTFIVSLKGLAPWISSVKYEKGGEDLKLYFTLRKEGLSPAALSLQKAGQDTLIVGNKQSFFQLLSSQQDPVKRLLGTVLERLEYIPSQDLYFAPLKTLTPEQAKLVPQTFTPLKTMLGDRSSFIVVFQLHKKLQGVCWSQNSALREKITKNSFAQQKEKWLLFEPREQSIQQAIYALSS